MTSEIYIYIIQGHVTCELLTKLSELRSLYQAFMKSKFHELIKISWQLTANEGFYEIGRF